MTDQAEQVTETDFAAMTLPEINEARRAGRLRDILTPKTTTEQD